MTTDVKMRLTAIDAASPTIKKVGGEIAQLDKQAGTAAGGLSSLAKVAGAAGLLAFGVQAARAAGELAELGNASIAMRASFEQMAGGAEDATAILESLQQASRNTVTEYDLMLAANRAMLLGVADSTDEFSTLMEIAAARGRAMGLSTTQAFNDIVTGLGRMSPLILDNLGIVVDQEKAFADYAATVKKSAKDLTDAERKQALLNQVIASSAGLLDDANVSAATYAGEGMAQLTTAWQDWRTAIGESIGPILDARYRELASFLQAGADELERQRQAVGITAGTSASGLTDTGDITKVLSLDLERAKADLATLEDELISTAQNAEAEIRKIYASTPGLSMAEAGAIYQSVLDGLITQIAAAEAKIADLERQIGAAVEAGGGFQVFIPMFGDMATAAGGAAAAVGEIARAIRAVEREAAASDVFRKFMGQSGAGDIAGGKFGALGDLASRRYGGIGGRGITGGPTDSYAPELSFGGGGGGFSGIDSELNALTSRVQGVLQGSLKSGIDLDSILPRADAIEEPARRLADVAIRGMESPWAAWFQTEMPALWEELAQGGDIKTAAAQMLRNFEDGLDLRLLDKGKAKERVRAALLGEQNVSQMAAEIAAELSAEMGVSLASAQQAASGVLGGDAAMPLGIDGAAVAQGLTDTFIGSINGMLVRYEGNGATAGASWQAGFLGVVGQGLPAGILAALVSQLLPGIVAAMQGQNTRTGAS